MARQKRLNLPGSIYHIMARGINRAAIFRDASDRREFISRFASAAEKTACQCFGWALMTNHFHLLLRTAEGSISEIMRSCLTGYAIYFNKRHKRSGYLFQNRFKSILCQEEAYLLELVRYIHLNPVRAGIIKTIDELDRYPWTGHATLMRKAEYPFQSVGEVLARFGRGKQAVAGYRQFMQDGWEMGRKDELTGGGLKRSAGGWRGVVELKKMETPWRGDEQILGDGEFVNRALKLAEEQVRKRERYRHAGWNMERLTDYVCRLFSVEVAWLNKKGRGNSIASAKSLIAYWGYEKLGLSQAEIGRFLKMSTPAVNYLVKTGKKLAGEGGHILIF